MTISIRTTSVDEPGIGELVASHHADMRVNSPADSMHALDRDGLRDPSLTLWGAWHGDDLVGMAALLRLPGADAEIKSMRVHDRFRGTGAGRMLLRHLVTAARDAGVETLWLETGSGEPFRPARTLYASEGFTECPPFGAYTADPHSSYMTRRI